jgi:hypothetical protein
MVMGATTEAAMDLCARHRRLLSASFMVYTLEAFRVLHPERRGVAAIPLQAAGPLFSKVSKRKER